MKHLSDKELLNLFLDGGKEKIKDRRSTHLDQCPVCMKKYREISLIYQKSPAGDVSLSRDLENRIIATYRESLRKPVKQAQPSPKYAMFPRIAAAAASVLIVIGTIFLFYYRPFSDRGETVPVRFSIAGGYALLNNNVTLKSGTLAVPQTMSLQQSTSAILQSGSTVTLKATKGCSLTLAESRIINNSRQFQFAVHRGSLLSHINHSAAEVSCSITTPHGSIESLGTRFLVMVSNDETEVTLAEGKILLTCTQSGESVTGMPGYRYIISRSLTFSKADNAVLTDINRPISPVSGGVSASTDPTLPEKPQVENTGDEGQAGDTTSETIRNSEITRHGQDRDALRESSRETRTEMRKDERKQNRESRDMRETRKGARNR
ncbi:MAG TPA: FecR domain-containing protein [Spirochaetota bacterium]|nr:FecR domain-containing protein [Spirochaetota bacterium]HPI88246.1 FecR domain-containing protein [Spirochaetota bacterium]HPR47210.1 FecR domain-containing protein [Spirochaetota bacterium]